MQSLFNQLNRFIENSPDLTYRLVLSVVVVFILWIIFFITIRIVNKKVPEEKSRYRWRKNLTYVSVFIGFLIVGRVWFVGLHSLATFLGLVTAGLAIALKDPVTDIAAWVYIIWKKPFDVGDRIELNNVKGDVIDQRVFKFSILEIGNWVDADQSTGRIIHIPNHKVFSDSLANYTNGINFIWNEIRLLITHESNWQKAKQLLQEIADKHLEGSVEQAKQQVQRAKKSYLIHYQHLTPAVYTDVLENGICLTIRHLTNPRKRRGISQSIWEDILLEFKKHKDIELAYQTIRYIKE